MNETIIKKLRDISRGTPRQVEISEAAIILEALGYPKRPSRAIEILSGAVAISTNGFVSEGRHLVSAILDYIEELEDNQ